ncbi:MAG: dienelactone hydrolase family protein [Chitinophagaceae bacterium]|nr:dienelactone hydrolase family protein [Chitinophagaceae bacterium]
MSQPIIYYLAGVLLFSSCSNNSSNTNETKDPLIKEENVSIKQDGLTMHCFVAFDKNTGKKRPAILVVPEWWGLNDYAKMRARKLATLGYIAMAVDVYGNGKIADNPDSAGKFVSEFYQNPNAPKDCLDASIATLKNYPQTDTGKIAAIGYCFGGGVVLNSARLGVNLKGVVSFHGDLIGVAPDKSLLKAKILVCQGTDDQFVTKKDVEEFKHQMDSIGADYTIKEYPGATHAFTNPDATALGKKFKMPIAYNAAADSASWNDMKDFFSKIFK